MSVYPGLAEKLSAAREPARPLLVLDRDAVTRAAAPGVVVQPVYEWLPEPSQQSSARAAPPRGSSRR